MRRGCFILTLGVFLGAQCSTIAQSAAHGLARITAMPGGSSSIELIGGLPSLFRPYFDLYLIEGSSDLSAWAPLATLIRTNNSDSPLMYVDHQASSWAARFYRTFTNQLPTPFPSPTGSYTVGTISFMLTDPSRSNRYNVATNSSFMVSLWYPATVKSGSLPSAYIEPQIVSAFANLYGMNPSVLAGFRSHARTGSQVADEAPYPVVLYSHGFRVGRSDNTDKCMELASHGYMVAAVDHADCLATVLTDGRVLATTASGLSAALFESNVTDLRFLLNALSDLNRMDPRFRGTLDLEHVGTMGWSYGGGGAAEIGRTDDRVKATVLLDAYLQNAHDVAWLGIGKPFLGAYNATSAFTTPFDQAVTNAYWMNLQNTQHQHFADWLAWLNSPSESGRRASVALNACLVSFFDKFLKNRDNHLLDDPSTVYPEIIQFGRK